MSLPDPLASKADRHEHYFLFQRAAAHQAPPRVRMLGEECCLEAMAIYGIGACDSVLIDFHSADAAIEQQTRSD